jgi:hypothetical protein
MTKLNRRSHIISVRVSEAELNTLRRRCVETGVGSLSELARDAMSYILKTYDAVETSDHHRNDQGVQLRDLQRKIESLAGEVEMLKSASTHSE